MKGIMKHSVCYRTAAALLLLGLTCGNSFAQEKEVNGTADGKLQQGGRQP